MEQQCATCRLRCSLHAKCPRLGLVGGREPPVRLPSATFRPSHFDGSKWGRLGLVGGNYRRVTFTVPKIKFQNFSKWVQHCNVWYVFKHENNWIFCQTYYQNFSVRVLLRVLLSGIHGPAKPNLGFSHRKSMASLKVALGESFGGNHPSVKPNLRYSRIEL